MAYGTFDRVMRYPVWIGAVLLSTGLALHYLGVQSLRNLGVDAPLFQPAPVVNSPLVPGSSEQFGANLFVSAFHILYAAASTFGLVVTVVGVSSLGFGLIFIQGRTVARSVKHVGAVATDPYQLAVLALASGSVVALAVSPLLRSVASNLVLFTTASATVFVASVLSVLRLERRAGPVTTVALVGPLTVATVFLSVIAGALASPATAAFVRRVTAGIVWFLLATVFAAVGLDRVLTRVFELQGAGFFLFWVGVDVVVGVAYGIASLRYPTVSIGNVTQRVRSVATEERSGGSRR